MIRADWRWGLLFAALGLTGCNCSTPPHQIDDGGGDAGHDAGMDAGHDAGTDAGFDAGLDAGVDAGMDAGTDAGMDAGVDGGMSDGGTVCDNDTLATGCVFGHCMLSSATRPLPAGALAVVIEDSIPVELQGDAISTSLCRVELTAAVPPSDLTLAITLTSAAPSDATLFSFSPVSLGSQTVPSHATAQTVTGVIEGVGSYGVTVAPVDWSVSAYIGAPQGGSTTSPEFLRNLSSRSFTAAFFDGTHLFVGNGARLLIYQGMPQNAATRPALVLGQVDLDSASSTTTASLFGNDGVSSIWSDGTRLVVGSGNRVLIWETIPTQNLTPADLVLGQPDFNSRTANNGGVSASSLSSPAEIDSDGNRLLVADSQNHRVLEWNSFPSSVNQAADEVVGQPDFASNAPYGGAFPLFTPLGTALDSTGLFVSGLGGPAMAHAPAGINNPASDFSMFAWQFNGGDPGAQVNRPAGMAMNPDGGVAQKDISLRRIEITRDRHSSPAQADFVLGHPDATRVVGQNWPGGNASNNPSRVSGSVIADGRELGKGSGTLLVPDDHRLLIYDTFPTYNFEPATRVLGQGGTSIDEPNDYRTVSASTLANPADVAINGTTLAVVDRGNNRVLLYNASSLGGLAPAAFAVVGQADATSYLANVDLVSASASKLSGPTGIALDGTRLIVSDSENHRVLIWNSVPLTSGTPADLVLGQADFTGRRPNHGRGDVSPLDGFSDVDADGMFYPTGVVSDGTHLLVADRLNHRVLIWDTFPTANDAPATRVLGQPSMTSVGAHGGAGAFTITATGFNLPTGLALSGTTLWVADTENNRVVRYDDVFGTPTPGAFVGQSSGTSVSNPNYNMAATVFGGNPLSPATTSTSVLRPRAITVAGGELFVSEIDSNRVHVFDGTTLAPVTVLGQSTPTGAAPNLNGIGAASLAEPMGLGSDGQNLWVADSKNHRVLGFGLSAIAGGASASLLVGQPSFQSIGFNGTSTAADGALSAPSGVALQANSLFVADTNNHRVVVFDATNAVSPTRIIGQPNDTLALPNAGGPVSARSLDAPKGVAAVGTHLAVADTGNNRVLLFDLATTLPDATLVLGQSTLTGSSANQGGAASLSTVASPGGVCSDGSALYVVDTGNHRVLGWAYTPVTDDQAADVVLGQPDGVSVLSNRGGAPTGATMSLPGACVVIGTRLYVADTGNNRILRFDTPTAANGAAASGVLGQPDFTSRIPASAAQDATLLAGPVSLAADGTNLYVVDRDLARVVEYGPGFATATVNANRVIANIGGVANNQVLGGVAALHETLFATRLFVSDTGGNRVADIGSVTRLLP